MSGIRRGLVAGVVCAGALVLGSLPGSATAGLSESGYAHRSVVFEYTGGEQFWEVPGGVREATFDLLGATGNPTWGPGSEVTPGGAGAQVAGTIAVAPRETLQIMVGGYGVRPTGGTQTGVNVGGFNGGGGAGFIGGPETGIGGGGGGASDVRRGSALTDRLIVAGGGGGAGGTGVNDSSEGTIEKPGGPGGDSSSSGADGAAVEDPALPGGTGGGGASAGSGGTGGSLGGTNGSLGQGAAGGRGFAGDGGGGGGGYYGGGGGGGGREGMSDFGGELFRSAGGGGGGGSSYTGDATDASITEGVGTGHGQITIDYTLPVGTRIVKPPRHTGRAHSIFRFRSNVGDAEFSCRLDRRRARPCSSPKDYQDLRRGWHVLRVRATSLDGIRDPTPAKHRFKVGPQK